MPVLAACLFLLPIGAANPSLVRDDTVLTASGTVQIGLGSTFLGDLDGDSVSEALLCDWADADGGANTGACHVFFLDAAGGVVGSPQKISKSQGWTGAPLSAGGLFGADARGLGDLDGDGVPDAIVSAVIADEAYVLLLTTAGTVKSHTRIASGEGGKAAFTASSNFGRGIGVLGDVVRGPPRVRPRRATPAIASEPLVTR